MTEFTREQELRARYGDINTMSGPVDPDHPTFDSLLSALQAVHTGKAEMDVLVRYHASLREQLELSRQVVLGLPEPEEVAEAVRDQKRITLSSLAIVGTMLDSLRRYIETPSQERVAECVDLLLQSMRVLRDVNAYLDAFIQDMPKTGEV